MKFAEAVGKTREEALKKAMKKIDTTIDKVKIECEEEESKGFFGFLARKEYRVKVTLKEENIKTETDTEAKFVENASAEKEETKNIEVDFEARGEKARKFLTEVFESIGIEDIEISIQKEPNGFMAIKILGKEASKLIGRRGDSLDALQMLTSLVTNKNESVPVKVFLDIENYREKREESLRRYASEVFEHRRIASTSRGTGDLFSASLLVRLLAGASLPDAARHAAEQVVKALDRTRATNSRELLLPPQDPITVWK